MRSAIPSGHEHEREESNPVEQFWRLPALPGAHSCIAAHRTMGSQGIRRELNPYLLVHSQACSDRYTTDTTNSRTHSCDMLSGVVHFHFFKGYAFMSAWHSSVST